MILVVWSNVGIVSQATHELSEGFYSNLHFFGRTTHQLDAFLVALWIGSILLKGRAFLKKK